MYTTTDLYLASTLIALGIPIKGVSNKEGNKKSFLFDLDQEYAEEIKDKYFNHDLTVDAKTLIEAIKELKARIYG